MKIAVMGLGYVGLANAVTLARSEEVVGYDIACEKIEALLENDNLVNEEDIEKYIDTKGINFTITCECEIVEAAVADVDYIIIATPTNYDEEHDFFDTSSIEDVIGKVLAYKKDAVFIIKSTVPIGYTERVKKQFNTENIIFSPEFLREGRSVYDSLHPTRIIVGEKSERGREVANLFLKNSLNEDTPVLLTNSAEAEAIKLFSNTYLATRIAFFNELDTFAEKSGLSTLDIINGVCLDPRIQNSYNNPSFGYGGYCLPKDTKQLEANFNRLSLPNSIIKAVVEANDVRKEFITKQVLAKYKPKVVGIFRLLMKADSDNFRTAAIIDVMKMLQEAGVEVVVYEPLYKKHKMENARVVKDIEEFKEISDVIIANRYDEILQDASAKVYTRDLFSEG